MSKHKRVYLWMDQYGGCEYAATVAELRAKCGGGRVDKMYCDRKDGSTLHIGYIIGGMRGQWFSKWQAVEVRA